jgi:hypothetical protein
MRVKQLEELWQEIGFEPNQENFRGYLVAHFEQIYLSLRDVIAVNINIFDKDEGMSFVLKCCKAFGCSIIHIDEGEIWIVKKDNQIVINNIPSRFSDSKEDHVVRGRILGYSSEAIENYFRSE